MSNFKNSELKSVDVDGNKIVYRDLGSTSDKTPLILLHHITAVIDEWDPYVVDELATSRRVIAFDSRGVGASEGVVPDTIEAMADVAASFIDKLGLKKVDLVGYSLGGFVAQVLIARRPELVRKVVLAATGPAGGENIANIQNVIKDAFAFAEREKIHPKQYLFFTPSKASQDAGRDFMRRLAEPFKSADQQNRQDAVPNQVVAFVKWGQAKDEYTNKLKLPTLVVNGDSDTMIPLKNSFDLKTRINGSHLSIYPNGNHGGIFENKEIFVTQVKLFLDA